jgi:TPR repeat protein
MIRGLGRALSVIPRDVHDPMDERGEGEADMARMDFGDMNTAALGEAPVADSFYELGMMYSIGRSVPVDYVTAHKWFNLAAMRGNEDATRLRREIADQMSEAEIAAAQRAARAWLKAN